MLSATWQTRIKLWIGTVLLVLFSPALSFTQSTINPPDLATLLADFSTLIEHSEPMLMGTEGWPVNGEFTMSIDKTTGLVTIKSGYSPGETTLFQFQSSNLGSIKLTTTSGEHSVFQQDENGKTTSKDSMETQVANINFNMKNNIRAVHVEVSTPIRTQSGSGTGVQVIAMSCTKEQMQQIQSTIDQINRLIGPNVTEKK